MVQRRWVGLTLNGESASKHLDDGTVEEVLPEHGGVDGSRHQDDANIWEGLDHVPEDHQEEVGLQEQRGV